MAGVNFSIILLFTVFGRLQCSSLQLEGHCVSYGSCGQDEATMKSLSCSDSHSARPLNELNAQKLKNFCPNLFNSQAKYIGFREIPLEISQLITAHGKKHSILKSIPTSENVCPWDLFIVRANYTFTGNCKRLKDIGKSVGIIGIRGMYTSCPATGLMRMVATIKLSRTTYTCCDSNEIERLQIHLEVPESVLSHCPSCWYNFREMYCQLHCSPSQSLFVQPTQFQPHGNGKQSVTAATFYVTTLFAEELFRSCRNVTIESMGTKALELFCGQWGYENCTAERWLQFLGDKDNGETPISLTPVLVDSSQVLVNGITIKPIDSATVACYQPIPGSNSNTTCSCQHCQEECT